jgi:hypothetical protein
VTSPASRAPAAGMPSGESEGAANHGEPANRRMRGARSSSLMRPARAPKTGGGDGVLGRL